LFDLNCCYLVLICLEHIIKLFSSLTSLKTLDSHPVGEPTRLSTTLRQNAP
jgi:hypothetical protein